MPGISQILGEWSAWALAVPSSLLALAAILRVVAYWRLEHSRLSIVKSVVSALSANPSLKANLDKLLGPLQPPSALPRLPISRRRGGAGGMSD